MDVCFDVERLAELVVREVRHENDPHDHEHDDVTSVCDGEVHLRDQAILLSHMQQSFDCGDDAAKNCRDHESQ